MILGKYLKRRIRDIEQYKKLGGFEAIKRAKQIGGRGIIDEVKRSDLRGRGGAGFPTGIKWELTRNNSGKEKYILCNADEGEVGTFKDRELLKNCPWLIIEGLILGGLAIGAKTGYIYLRDEYSYIKPGVEKAIEDVEKNILKPLGIDFSINLRMGAGAYICGEETALIESIEENRGEPRLKPPFPPQQGLYGLPTAINNVETLSNIPWILANGPNAFSAIGTGKSKGTKLFSVSGDAEKPGVYELEMGEKLRVLVEDYAGAHDIKCVQVGGASGRIISGEDLDRRLCFEDVLGAGAIVVFNNSRSIIEIMRDTMAFFVEESCGKCTPCREGSFVIYSILDRMNKGMGTKRDIKNMKEIANAMIESSFCGLGQAACTGLLDSLNIFEDEYNQAILNKV